MYMYVSNGSCIVVSAEDGATECFHGHGKVSGILIHVFHRMLMRKLVVVTSFNCSLSYNYEIVVSYSYEM